MEKLSCFSRLICFSLVLLALPAYGQKKNKKKKADDSQKQLVQEAPPIEMTDQELRLRLDDFYEDFALLVEIAADSIIGKTSDKQIKQYAQLWKIYAIPAAQRSIFVNDAYGGFVDAALLSFQMQDFFTIGAGKDFFGEHQQIAINAANRLVDGIITIGQNLSPDRDVSQGAAILKIFAREHPIENIYFHRTTTLAMLEKYLEAEKIGFKGLIVDVNRTLQELSTRLNYYLEGLPKQVRWQSEYLLDQTVDPDEILGKVDSLTEESLRRVDSLLYQVDRLVDLGYDSLSIIDEQADVLIGAIQRERAIVLSAVTQERLATIDAIQQERLIVLQQVSEERKAVMDDIENLTSQTIAEGFKEAERIIDKLYWRTVLLLGGIVLFISILLIVLRAKLF